MAMEMVELAMKHDDLPDFPVRYVAVYQRVNPLLNHDFLGVWGKRWYFGRTLSWCVDGLGSKAFIPHFED